MIVALLYLVIGLLLRRLVLEHLILTSTFEYGNFGNDRYNPTPTNPTPAVLISTFWKTLLSPIRIPNAHPASSQGDGAEPPVDSTSHCLYYGGHSSLSFTCAPGDPFGCWLYHHEPRFSCKCLLLTPVLSLNFETDFFT